MQTKPSHSARGLYAACAAFAALMLGGCSVASDVPDLTLEYRIDPAFTPEQADAIRLGMAFWEGELPGADLVELDAPAGGCEPGGAGHSRHCLTACPAGHDALTDPGETYAGREFPGKWIAVLDTLQGEELALVAAHEFGHRLGLDHADEGLMAESMGSPLWGWELSPKAIRHLERRGWR